MKPHLPLFALAVIVVAFMTPRKSVAQTATTNTPSAWLEKAPPVPAFTMSASRVGWEMRRKEVRAELNQLLGKLPPRPKIPAVKTLSREDRGEYLLEKFQFDNGAGAI